MNSKVAVLSSNFQATSNWLRKRYKITASNDNCLHGEDKTYCIVSQKEQVLGMLFDDYLVAPDHETLEDIVKTRIIW